MNGWDQLVVVIRAPKVKKKEGNQPFKQMRNVSERTYFLLLEDNVTSRRFAETVFDAL